MLMVLFRRTADVSERSTPLMRSILRYTAVRLREECAILEINTRVWVPTTWARLAELQGTGLRGSRVFHVVLGEGQVVDMYETTNFGLKCLDILSLLHTVNM